MPLIVRPTITETFLERVKATPNAIGFQFRTPDSAKWNELTFSEFFGDCRLVSFGLMGLGVAPGDRVAIISNTRYEWSLCDMAILGAGAVTVPVYASNTVSETAHILNHSGAQVAIVEDAKQLQKLLEGPLSLRKIVVLDPMAIGLVARQLGKAQLSRLSDVLTLQALRELGRRQEAHSPGRFNENLMSAAPSDLITICYTSGTTGVPKGAMLTHANMMSVLADCATSFGSEIQAEHETVLSFLPFSHILGKVESMAIWTFGWREAFAENIDKLPANLTEIRPTLLFTVPRTFEKAYAKIQNSAEAAPRRLRQLYDWALDRGYRYYRRLWAGGRPNLREAAEYLVAKSAVLGRVTDSFGGRLKFAVCGGAPLPREIAEFFQVVGITILEGYGLTETCAPVTLNTPDHLRFGTVGRPMAEATLKIAPDGEILIKSRKVFRGYYNQPAETERAFEGGAGGWFRTGDIGVIDDEGYLRITDRKKDIIITSGGKNVAPQKIENLAKSQKLISQFVVHGDRRHFLTALLTLDREEAIRFASENQILFSEYAELVKNTKMIGRVQKIIDELNSQLASFETIKRFVILPNEFTVEGGELTPSLKIRRGLIDERYRSVLDSLYS